VTMLNILNRTEYSTLCMMTSPLDISKTCLKRNLKGPEHFSTEARFPFLVQWGVESNWVHSALRALIGILCQPRVIMMMEKLVE
jgi:hypothetical protein